MKKALVIFIGILIGLFLILSFLDKGSGYSAEVELTRINNKFVEYSKDPKIIPDINFKQIFNRYRRFTVRYPDSPLTPLAHIQSGRIFMIQKDFEQARGVFEEVITSYDSDDVGVSALSEIGRTFAMEKDFDNVLIVYERIMKNYPLTDLGIRTPILIAQVYESKNEPVKMRKAFNDAILHYDQLIAAHPDTLIEFQSIRSKSICYISQKKWTNALQDLGDLFLKFPDPKYWTVDRAETTIKTINTIASTKLGNYDIPIRIYQDFLSQNPNHPFQKILERMVQSFKLLRDENIVIEN